MCMWDDSDPPKFYVSKLVRARKPHRCSECSSTIEPGETYKRVNACWDWGPTTLKTCARCLAACRWLEVICDGWMHEAVLEDLTSHWDDDDVLRSPALARLTIAARRNWRRSWKTEERYPADLIGQWVDASLAAISERSAA